MSIRPVFVFVSAAAVASVTCAGVAFAQAKPRVSALRGLRPSVATPVVQPSAPPAKIKPAPKQLEVPQQVAKEVEQADTGPAPDIEAGERLDVMCFGAGSANKLDVISGYGTNSVSGSFHTMDGTFGSFSGSGSSWATVYAPRSQDFADQVSLYLENGEGRVRMPRTMLPTIRGGKDGWFKLKDIKIAPNEITASVAVNILNNPKLRLDRYSGALSISGKAGDYVAGCRRIDPQRIERKF